MLFWLRAYHGQSQSVRDDFEYTVLMSFKDFSIFGSGSHFVQGSRTNFGRGVRNIFGFRSVVQGISIYVKFFFHFKLLWPSCSAEWSYFGRGYYGTFMWICILNLGISIKDFCFSSSGDFVLLWD